MKWVISTIVAGLVLTLGIALFRSERAQAVALQTHQNAQALAVFATQKAANPHSDDAVAVPDRPANKPGQPAASNDVAPAPPGKANKPAVSPWRQFESTEFRRTHRLGGSTRRRRVGARPVTE